MKYWGGQIGIGISFVTIQRDWWREHLKGVLAEFFLINTKVEAFISRTELITSTFSQIKVIDSDRKLEGDLSKVIVTESIEPCKSVTLLL